MDRRCALGPPEMMRLDLWAAAFDVWFEPWGAYLVGSCTRTTEYRDVDVRVLLDDDDPLLADPDRLLLLHVAISAWGQQMTGLPIDFQFQGRAEWDTFDGERNPLGSRWRTVHRDRRLDGREIPARDEGGRP